MKEKEKINYSTRQFIGDMYTLIREDRMKFLFASVLIIATNILALYTPYFFGRIVQLFAYITPTTREDFMKLMFMWIGIVIAQHAIDFYGYTIASKIAEKARLDVLRNGVSHVLNIGSQWHENQSSGMVMNKIYRGGLSANGLLMNWFNAVIEWTVQGVGVLIALSVVDVNIAIAFLLFAVVYLLMNHFFRNIIAVNAAKVNEAEDTLANNMYENISNYRTVTLNGIVRLVVDKINDSLQATLDAIHKRINSQKGLNLFFNYYITAFRIICLIVIGFGVINGRFEVGFIAMFYGYMHLLANMLRHIRESSQQMITARVNFYHYNEIIKSPLPQDIKLQNVDIRTDWKKISIKNLTFSYGNNYALNKISLDINRGEKIGVVGLSGAGKSTLFKLLTKERSEYEGEILVDGVSLRTIRDESYYKQVTVVLQEAEVFNMSLKDNVTITSKKTDKKQLEFALKTSHLSEILPKLPKGEDTIIGQKGVKLSGGEKQRLGIARAIYKNPSLLLLDEATSHLDMETEEKIQDSLHEFFKGVTAVVIAHRLSTIKEMDRIVVIEDGKIIETGTPTELLEKKGRFRELWNKQLI